MPTVVTGLERVLSGDAPACDGKRLGLVVNATAVDSDLQHAIDRMASERRFELRALFGPEHGLRGDAQDMISVDPACDRQSGLPVHSLYGADESTLSPTPESLAGLDALVFDIQDVGARYYTYVWTMVLCMRACARAGVGFVVLDRPNPIGGDRIEGGAIAAGYDSFVGLCSVPNRHGLTAGEIARMAMDRERLDLDLTIVPMQGWQRAMRWSDTGLPWVQPSPNMPTPDTALVYPGMCLVEGTELSEGRGTTRPFELSGAPFVDGHRLAEALAAEALPGLRCRPLVFTPMFQKHARTACGGVQLHVTDERAFNSYLTGVAFVRAAHALWPDEFAWRGKAYEFVADRAAIDLLTGSPAVRQGIEAGATLAELAATWAEAERAFATERQPWLIYD